MMNIFNKEIISKLTNGFFYFGSSIVALLFSLFTFPIYSTYLSIEDFGLIGYFASLKGFIVPLFNLSLSNYYLMRFFKNNKQENEESLFNILFYLSINNVLVSGVFIFIGYQYFEMANVSYPFYPYFILMLGMAFFEPYKMFLLQQYRIRKQGLQFFLFSVLAPILNASFSLLLIIVFDLGVFGRMAGMAISMLALGIICLVFIKRFIKPNYSFSSFKVKILSMIPMVIAGYAYIPIETFDRIFLEKLKMPEQFGFYAVGLQISGFFLMAATALFKAFEPNIFQAVINDNKKKLRKEIIQYFSIVIIGFVVFFFLLEPMINILTKGRFMESLYYAKLLSVGKLLSALGLVFSGIILAKQEVKMSAYLIYIASFLSVLFYPILIKEYMFDGALFARIIIPFIIIIASVVIIKYIIPLKESKKL